MKPRYFPYVRVSDDKQEKSGLSITSQKARLEEYFQRRMHPKVTWDGQFFIDSAVSAYKVPIMKRFAIKDIQKIVQPGDYVAAVAADRMTRSLDCYVAIRNEWIRKGIHVVLMDLDMDFASDIGQMVLNILVMVAEMESRRRSQRMIEVNHVRRKAGLPLNGKLPWGFRREGQFLVPDEEERAAMRKMLEFKEATNASIYKLAELGRRLPYNAKRGPWTIDKVYSAIVAAKRIRANEQKESA